MEGAANMAARPVMIIIRISIPSIFLVWTPLVFSLPAKQAIDQPIAVAPTNRART
jgi:hypothetical protein